MSAGETKVEGKLALDIAEYIRPWEAAIATTARGSDQIERQLTELGSTVKSGLASVAQELAKAASGIESFGAQLGGLQSSLSNVESATSSMAADLRLVSAESQKATGQLAGLAQEVGQINAGLGRMEAQLGDVRLLLTGVDESTAAMTMQLRSARTESQQFATASLSAFGDLRILLNAVDENLHTLTQHMLATAAAAKQVKPPAEETNRWTEGLRALAGIAGMVNPRIGQLVSAFHAVEGAAKSMDISLGKAALTVGAIAGSLFAAKEAFDFTAEGVRLSAEMEQISIAFETIIGNAQQAHATLTELKYFADHSPFLFPEVANAGRQLLAMGIAAKDVTSTLRMIADVSAGLNQPIGDIAYLFGKVHSETKASGIDIKEMAMRGIPIYQALADVLHTTTAQIREMTREGEVSADVMEEAFRRMTDRGGRFFNMTAREARSLKGEVTTLQDAWQALERAAGDSFIGGASSDSIEDLTRKINDLKPAAERFGAALHDALIKSMPLIEKILDGFGWVAEKLTGTEGQATITASASPSVTLGLDKTKDPTALLNTARALNAARYIMADTIQRADSSNDGLNQGGLLVHTQDVTDAVKANFDKAYEVAGKTAASDALKQLIAQLQAKVQGGGKLTTEEVTQLQHGIAAVGGEVDQFRTALTAAHTDLLATQKTFETNPVTAKAMTNRDKASDLDELVRQTSMGLGDSRGVLAMAANALRPGRDADRQAAAEPVASPAPGPAAGGGQDQPAGPGEPAGGSRGAAAAERHEAVVQRRTDAEAQQTVDRISSANYQARIAQLRAFNKELDADLLEIESRFAGRINNKATSDAERAALRNEMEAEQTLAVKRADDAAQKQKSEAAESAKKQADEAAKQQAEQAAATAKRTTEMQLQAQLVSLRAFGKEYEATILEIDGRLRERLSAAHSDDERAAAQALHDAEIAAAEARHAAEDARTAGTQTQTSRDLGASMADARLRVRNASNPDERSLALLDLRRAMHGGYLDDQDEMQRLRLRKRMGLAGDADPNDPLAVARQRSVFGSTSQERELGHLDARAAAGNRLSAGELARQAAGRRLLGIDAPAASTVIPRLFTPGNAPSDIARNAVAKQAAIQADSGDVVYRPGGPSGSYGTPRVNVNAPGIDEGAIGRAIAAAVPLFTNVVTQQVGALERRIRAAAYGARANGGA